ncbi:MAG: histidine phosphotransferase family protein [Erythrobacter sp.]|jgi:histidine phosphotransferase ChpT|nr:histidine phosphotransferase family protein [Erythrobacter sp.]
MTSQTDLAALLCSRLCHDLLSPVGALSNGLELLADEDDPEMRASCIDLLEQSAKKSTDKLKFFRLAFGAAGGFGDIVPVDEAKEVIAALAGDAKGVELNWAVAEASLPKPAVKVLLNLSQIALDALVRGGTLDIGAEKRPSDFGGNHVEIVARASAERLAFDKTIGSALQGELGAHQITSRTAAAHMVALLAEELGGGLQYKLTDDALVLGAIIPEPEGMIG